MDPNNFYEEIRIKYQGEDRARLVMQQLRTYQENKQKRKWWQKLRILRKTKTQPKPWD